MKEKFFISAFEEYAKRLQAYCKFSLYELQEQRLPENPSQGEIASALDKEASQILKLLDGDEYVIAMCVEGKQKSSEELAQLVNDLSLKGRSKIAFIVGGSYGLSGQVKDAADLKLSMSLMTFPHHLARIMLCEQIYRAFKINEGSHYHK